MVVVLLSVAVAIACSLTLCRTPLLLGLWIFILAFSVAFMLRVFTFSWIGLLMFLIYVGGLLVIFAYFVALRPNEIHLDKRGRLACGAWIMVGYLLFFFFFLIEFTGFSYGEGGFINYLLLNNNIFFFVLLSIVLFFALVRVVKLCYIDSVPLRPYGEYV